MMTDMNPAPTSFWQPFYLCFLGIVAPARLALEDEKYKDLLNKKLIKSPERRPNSYVIRRAFWSSLALVAVSGALGLLVGLLLDKLFGCARQQVIIALQVGGAMLLLWGTLFVRGWEIQTYHGGTLVELVNRWIYRAMYCLGTAVIVCSLAWTPCVP